MLLLAALEKGPLDPEGLREATGKAVRNLGAEGKKKGLTTTLPVALGEVAGLRRYPPRSHQRPLRSAALSICALASESPARLQALARASSHRAGAQILQLDRAGIGCRFSDLFGAGRKSSQDRARSVEAGADRSISQATSASSCRAIVLRSTPLNRRRNRVTRFSAVSIRYFSCAISKTTPDEMAGNGVKSLRTCPATPSSIAAAWWASGNTIQQQNQSLGCPSSRKTRRSRRQSRAQKILCENSLATPDPSAWTAPKAAHPRIAALRKSAASA